MYTESVKNLLVLFITLFITLFLISYSLSPVHAKTTPLTFSTQARQDINILAKDILTNGVNPQITAVKAQLDPQDYATVKTIGVLPDSPWYIFKRIGRNLRIFFTFDKVGKTHQQLKAGNQKTLEALLLIEKATAEKDSKKHDRLIALANTNLEHVGSDFDQIQQTIKKLKAVNSPDTDTATIQDEAFRFASQYLKHQVLLQQQEDRLNNADFLTIESTRVKHLASLADIVVASNRDPEVFSEQLAETLSSQVGSNYSRLSLMAVLRDLENNASSEDQVPLQTAQSILLKEFEVKFTKLSKTERLQLIERYINFIHGNPIRQFQAYNLIAKNFTSKEMQLLTASFKDKAAQNFKSHLTGLDNETDQRQFIQTLFGADPIDLRLLAYTEIQLEKPKVLGVSTLLAQANPPAPTPKAEAPSKELDHLQQLKKLLGNQLCQTYGQNPEALKQTRFFGQATSKPDILDLRVNQFLTQSFESCENKTPETLSTLTALTSQVEQTYINQAKKTPATKLPTRAKAKEILQEEKIETKSQDEQKVAEQVAEEIQQIKEETSTNPEVVAKDEALVEKIKELVATESGQTTELVTDVITDEQTIIEEIIQSDEPTEEEIVQKEEQIIEEIVDSADSGTVDPIVEELPTETQDEITEQITSVANPSPTVTTTEASPTPTVESSPLVSPTLEPSPTSTAPEPVTSPEPVAPEPTLEPATAPAL